MLPPERTPIETDARKVGRASELLALLILHPNGIADDEIAELMFAGMAPERGKQNVQMAAYSLRGVLNGKATVRYSAGKYQLSPQLELVADVHTFDAALARARGATGEALVQAFQSGGRVPQPLWRVAGTAWTYRLE